jgi:UPF0755 protein
LTDRDDRADRGDLGVHEWSHDDPGPELPPGGEGAGPQRDGRQRAADPGPPAAPYDAETDGYEEFFDYDHHPRGTYVRVPRRARGMRRLLSVTTVVVVVILLAVGGVVWWGYRQVNPPGAPGEPVSVEVPFGATTEDIADILDGAGVVSSSRLFQEYVRFRGKGPFKAGTYFLSRRSSLSEALDALDAGPVPVGFREVTFPEGLRLSELSATLTEAVPRFSAEKLAAAFDSGEVRSRFQPAEVARPEGFLFPDTYRVEDDQTEVQALAQMAAQFDQVATEIGLEQRAAALGFTPYQIVTIASMIEEEAQLPDERPMVARVIYNRLAQGMRLDIDATTLYAVGKEGNTLTQSDLDSDSPYNTRKVSGLPPGPISAPGRAALEAALRPADGPWLYYVLADSDGRHFFTDSAEEFNHQVEVSTEKGLLG